MYFDQREYDVRFEWGLSGIEAFLAGAVIVPDPAREAPLHGLDVIIILGIGNGTAPFGRFFDEGVGKAQVIGYFVKESDGQLRPFLEGLHVGNTIKAKDTGFFEGNDVGAAGIAVDEGHFANGIAGAELLQGQRLAGNFEENTNTAAVDDVKGVTGIAKVEE